MYDVDNTKSVSCAEKEYVYEILTDEEEYEMEDLQKEPMELMVAEGKPHFTNIGQRLQNFCQPIYSYN